MKFYIIGIDDSSSPCFNEEIKAIVADGTVFTGGTRHYDIVRHLLPDEHLWIPIVPPMTTLFDSYAGHDEVIAFASGDPLFYGFASTVQRMMPAAELQIYPFFHSLQLLAHRAILPYHDMTVVSLTGRDWLRFDESLIRGESLIGVLTDNNKHTPSQIAKRMLDYGYTNYEVIVGELLGNREESVHTLSVQEVAERTFRYPNNLLLRQTKSRHRPFGIPDKDFMHLDGREKMITKKAIRLALLAEMNLRECRVFWDIGFCTGSVSIEAKLQFPHLQIFSFEQRTACEEIIKHNVRKFGTPGIMWQIGDFTAQDLNPLPRPDTIFIGGHGGKLREIVSKCQAVMNAGAAILFNSVSEESKALILSTAKEHDLKSEIISQIRIDENNCITIIKLTRTQCSKQ